MKCHRNIFHAHVSPMRIPQKVYRATLHWTCGFPSGGICMSRSVFWCDQGAKCRHTIFHAHVGSVWIPQKEHRDMLCQTCVFASGGICRSRNVVWCNWGVKHWCTIFHACVGLVRTHTKHTRTCYVEVVFWHPLRYVGHVVHSGASRVWNVEAQFFMLGRAWCGAYKKCPGQVTPNLYFCIQFDLHVT
jgi:hypothetical protein